MTSGDPVEVALDLDGVTVTAMRGQSLLAAMVANGRWAQRKHPVTGELRAGYCGMGVCFECECEVDGRSATRACMVVLDGPIRVRTGRDTISPRSEEAG